MSLNKQFIALLLFVITPLVSFPANAGTPLVVKIKSAETWKISNRDVYFENLLHLALKNTVDNYGPYIIRPQKLNMGNQRLRMMLINKQGLDVVWSTSNPEREKDMLPIRLSLLKNLNEYRILLIRHGDQNKFDKVDSFSKFKRLKIGSGIHWYDTKVMQANDIPTIVSSDHESLYRMLASKRFDYMTRGLYELHDTRKHIRDMGLDTQLTYEDNLLIYYPAPYYFFVHKDNHKLAQRIEKGLKTAMANGSFDKLFFSVEEYREGFAILNKHNRTVFSLENMEHVAR